MKIEIPIPELIEKLLQILYEAGGMPRLVGGSVRDALLKIQTSDIDIITVLRPDKVIEILTKHHIIVKATGIKYGTVTAIIQGIPVEITTLRVDKECDGRHVNAEFTDDFEADAKRRDFTINSMSYCPFEQKLYDYTGGYEDLIARKVVFIGESVQRIEEDYLRILRFFRFSNRFARNIDMVSLEACIKRKKGLLQLSKERILMEMTKIMESSTCHKILDLMIKNDILTEVIALRLTTDLLSDINENAPSIFRIEADLRFAALMYDNPLSILEKTLYDMKFSNRMVANIIALIRFRKENPKIYNLPFERIKNTFTALWVENIPIDPYILISEAWKSDSFEIAYKIMDESPPKFPINGSDLINRGFVGKDIKQELATLKKLWIESDFKLNKEMLLNSIR